MMNAEKSSIDFIKEVSSSGDISIFGREELISMIEDLLKSLTGAEKAIDKYQELFSALTMFGNASLDKDLSVN